MKKVFLFISVFLLMFGKIFSQTVYKNETGQYYHTAKCKNVGKNTPSMDLSKALLLGYFPCKTCHPPTKVTKSPAKKKAAPKSKSTK